MQPLLPHPPERAAPPITKELFGTMPDGRPVDRYALANAVGVTVKILTYGCIVQQVVVPDSTDGTVNLALGFATLDEYVTANRPYFGAVVGRYANRIAGGTFTLEGVEHRVGINEPPNSLHGGSAGFDKQVWDATVVNGAALELRHTSPDGDEGFPGALSVVVTYTLGNDDTLRVDYSATTDRATVVNLTSHAYWNLSGEGSGSTYDHLLSIDADRYLPTDATLIPSGKSAEVHGTAFDFRAPTAIGARISDVAGGYDHNFVLNRPTGLSKLIAAARVDDPATGRTLEILTTEPGLQFYAGNHLDGSLVGPSGRPYRRGDGFALETQHFPDSPNHASFPTTVLRPGEQFTSTTVYRLGRLERL